MGFYNVLQGDAPYSKKLADNYAMSDNYHQPVMGGTGANSIMLGFGDAIWFSDENGHPEMPPHNPMTFAGGPVDTPTTIRATTRSQFLVQRSGVSPMSCSRTTSPGRATTISGTDI